MLESTKYLRSKHSSSVNENLDFRFGSSSSASGEFCRICHESDNINPLITPCMCAGSLRYVHQNCLQLWLSASETSSCELCKYPFNIQSKVKPFCEWKSLEMTGIEKRRLFCAVLFHLAAALCVIWSLCVLIERSAEEVRTNRLEWPLVTKLIVVTVGLTGGIVFMYIQCKQYLNLCYRWRARNRILLIQNAPEKIRPNGVAKDESQLHQHPSRNSSSVSLRLSNGSNFLASTEVTIENNNEVFQAPSQVVAKIENTHAISYEIKNESSQQQQNPMTTEVHASAVFDMEKPSTSKQMITQSNHSISFDHSTSDQENDHKTSTSIFRENHDILDDTNYPSISDKSNLRVFNDVKSLRRFSDTKLLIVGDGESAMKTSAPPNANRSSQVLNITANNSFLSSDTTNLQTKNVKSLPNIVNV